MSGQPMKRFKVFISYTRADRPWVDRLQQMMAPLMRDSGGIVRLWDDSQIQPGAKWRTAIEAALAEAKVVLLLVSDAFLASEFVRNEAVPTLLAAAEAAGVKVFWVCLSPCLVEDTPIHDYQPLLPANHYLAALDEIGQLNALKTIALELKKALQANPQRESLATLQLGDRLQRPLPRTPTRPLILLDQKMPRRLGILATEITLYKAATLESVGGDKRRLEALYGSEIEVLTPEDIFLPELYLLPWEGALANSWLTRKIKGKPIVDGSPVTPLLPLRERIRDLFSSSELAEACSLRMSTNEEGMNLEITLMLYLEGRIDPYPISRTYAIREENLIDEDLPVIALWPNISDLHWKHYVIFAEDRSVGLTVDGFPGDELHRARDGEESVKYLYCDRFPDLIKLSEGGQYRGLIPINPPPPSSNTSSTWCVGIDFGTSFTNFFINAGSGPVRWALETRVIPLTLATREVQLDLLYKYFIPETLLPKDANPPILTELNTYGWQEVRGTIPKLFHQARVQWPSSNANALKVPSVRTGFTWNQLQYQRPFLKEIALLISCNASGCGAASVSWSVSYPSDFSANELARYKRTWEIICSEVETASGIQQKIQTDGDENSFQTESTAFASYFLNYLLHPMVHAACIKIGQQATEISIWQDNTLLHQVTFPFTGRDIFNKALQAKPSFIPFLFTPQLTDSIAADESKLRQDPIFNRWLDNFLRYDSQEFLSERMPIHRAEENKQLLDFVSLLAIGFGGLYHYLGLILKALQKEGRLRKQAAMPVYIGGDGARFLHWLDESSAFNKGCDSDLLFEALQRQSAGFTTGSKGSARTRLSNAFNDETACGLISNGVALKSELEPAYDPMIAGEQLIINDLLFNTLDRVSIPAEMNSVDSFSLGNLNELKQFVQNYDTAISDLGIKSLLPIRNLLSMKSIWEDVEIQVRAICLDRMNKQISDLEPEPGFIISLRALHTALVREWAERF